MSRDVNVADKSAFGRARGSLPGIYGDAQQHCSEGIQEAQRVCSETQEELANSRSLLAAARQEEQRCLQEVHIAEAWVARATDLERPAALAALASAKAAYAQAVARRIRMEQRVRLAERCVSIAGQMRSQLGMAFNAHSREMSEHIRYGSDRMLAAEEKLGGYLGQSIPGVHTENFSRVESGTVVAGAQYIGTANDLQSPQGGSTTGSNSAQTSGTGIAGADAGGISGSSSNAGNISDGNGNTNGKTVQNSADNNAGNSSGLSDKEKKRIKKKTGWSDEVVNSIRSWEEYEIYQKAELKEVEINGKKCLIRSDIDWNQQDPYEKKTNKERVEQGRPPLDKEGKPIELHHIGQHPDSPLAELTMEEHRGKANYTVLHNKSVDSEIDRNAFNTERKKHWLDRAENMSEVQ